jgi:hypothetical protein
MGTAVEILLEVQVEANRGFEIRMAHSLRPGRVSCGGWGLGWGQVVLYLGCGW